ncbi:MAG TPA: BTAD domain-containing putative transcriptional regulator, partial [Aggregatilineales bacterium]|nr:BTAD domain-containing putative transcriptional regulator [Aggregatilineales bacterium]
MAPIPKFTLKISALGGLSIQENGAPVTGFVSRKVDALLVYLASSRREHPREALAELLWDDLPQARAMANLRMVLSSLQQHLAAYVVVSRQSVAMNLDSAYWLDAAELEDALDASQDQSEAQGGMTPAGAERLEHALALYQGDFLAGFHVRDGRAFEDWTLIEQERLRNRVVEAHQALVQEASERADFPTGIARARRLLQLDPMSEEVHRELMTMLAQSGQRSAALAQYEICRQVLQDELDVEPDDETTALYEDIQAGQIRVTAESAAVPRNLPMQATPFVGRTAELAQIARQLQEPGCRLLTLVGPGGIGKTRLALQAGVEHMKDFRHGVTIVPLVAVTAASDLPAAVAGALKIPLLNKRDLAAQVIDYLSDKHLLLVMDNLEYVLDGVGLLSEMLANAPTLKIVATSRERLNLQEEWVMNVGGMDVPDAEKMPASEPDSYSALQLFAISARRAKADFKLDNNGNLSAATRICRLVEGLPLGIELAAAWVQVLSCEQIAAQIEHDLDFL